MRVKYRQKYKKMGDQKLFVKELGTGGEEGERAHTSSITIRTVYVRGKREHKKGQLTRQKWGLKKNVCRHTGKYERKQRRRRQEGARRGPVQ